MAKTKAEIAKMVREERMKRYGKLSMRQQFMVYKRLKGTAKADTAVGKIEMAVLKKLIIKQKKGLRKINYTDEEWDILGAAPKKASTVPKGSHKMPDGSIMKDSAMPKKKGAK